ncbi:MAG: hypothetical protein LKH74_03740 [Levilactobacillus sp.]|uniref:hypothetical protein n=1 Tax=Levilactobacillus sp. TaxID=2767919 RepID=UPI00258D3E1F|nr:hypothetical protein [Levilactobacillus sp.]MCI1553013.1 hypothetical protein [Levilactobacillus sp.]MCI1598154.1 hypothetical protein [Levilactobacillus sp.]MCI1605017.1 hypothetical protein [Levilactobacillus sp.]
MQSSLKKSLYLGLAALSFVSVAAVSTNASAKSYAKAGAYTTLKADPTERNVEATGTNALYTKPGTVKGAKIVASKKTMTTLATSKKSANYFRAYGQKVTNRGSVYYRVVTMDGKYRGYVYGGKTEGTFAAGVKKADTTVDKTATDSMVGKTVYFANPGTKNVTWTAPKYTQYKASKQIKDTSAYASDVLTVTDAVKKTREGSVYYYVKDAKNPAISGWIYAKAVTPAKSDTAKAENGITFNFVNKANGAQVSSAVYEFPTGDTLTSAQAYTQAKALVPAGYTIAGSDAASAFGTTTANYAKKSTETVYVTENNAITLGTTLKVYNADMTEAQSSLAFPADVVAKIQADTFFKQANGLTAKASDIETHLKADGAGEFTVVTDTKNNTDGTFVAYKFTLQSATDGVFGGNKATIYYTAEKGSVTSTTTTGTFTPAN